MLKLKMYLHISALYKESDIRNDMNISTCISQASVLLQMISALIVKREISIIFIKIR